MGVYHLKKNKPGIALENFKRAQELDVSTELIHFFLGSAYLALDDREKAKAEFEQSKSIPEIPFPNYPEI
jgi:hypothetical protein